MLSKVEKIFLFILIIFSATLRFVNLGYSEFQGDEIRALYLKSSAPLLEHLFSQKKGPVQFIVTFIINELLHKHSEFWSRFLFALAGLACVLVLYLFVKEISNWRSGLIASTLFSFNGFFVAFSRIVQYQSFVIMFTLLTAYFLIKLNKTGQIKYLYFSSISAALGLLSHYDIAFAGLYFTYLLAVFLISAFKNKQLPIKHVVFSGLIFIGLVSTFYVPFMMHQASQNTASYLFMRINGSDGGNKTTDTFITYLIYNPLSSFYIYLVGVLLSSVVFFRKNWLIAVLWFLPPFVIMNFFASIPGTHIYTYVIPAIILFSLLLGFLYEKINNSILKYVSTALFVIFSAFLFVQSFMIFVDHRPEYPWNSKKVMFWPVSLPDRRYHLSLFGFPYNRKLEEANSYIKEQGGTASINSNEGSKIIRYYIDLKLPDKSMFDAYLYIYGPQSLTKSKSGKYKNLEPTKVFSNENGILSELYLVERPRVKGVVAPELQELEDE